jgi:hypothetical protein
LAQHDIDIHLLIRLALCVAALFTYQIAIRAEMGGTRRRTGKDYWLSSYMRAMKRVFVFIDHWGITPLWMMGGVWMDMGIWVGQQGVLFDLVLDI